MVNSSGVLCHPVLPTHSLYPLLTTTSSPSSNSKGFSLNAGAVAGGVVGGVVAISAAAFIIFLKGRRKHRQGSPPAAVLDPIPHPLPLMDEFRPQLSDGGTFAPPSLPRTSDARLTNEALHACFYAFVADLCVSSCPPSFPYAQDQDDPITFPWNQKSGTDPVPKVDTRASEDEHWRHPDQYANLTATDVLCLATD